jgi:tetratricopeptide (TPR) repeat protein
VFYAQGSFDAAVASSREALQYKPDFVAALSNLGTALYAQGRLAEATESYERAVQLDPNYADAHFNLGIAREDQGMLAGAIDSYRTAVRLKPDYANAHKNLGMALLLNGNFAEGWPEYEWRWKTDVEVPGFRQPFWDGSPLAGRAILLHTEQGSGDTLQFVRYAAILKRQGAVTMLRCPRSLVPLLSNCQGIDRMIPFGDPLPEFDVHASLMSLPGLLKTSEATIPSQVPYLFADDRLTDHWRNQLSDTDEFKIGIAWQGASGYRRDAQRSISLEQFAPLAQLEGVRLFSLQKGPGRDQLAAFADRLAVTDLGRELDETTGAFMDTAAVMRSLNLVITSDTVIAHLAAGLGIPVWVALCRWPDWRWLLDRTDCPWYPSMRLFRQTEPGNWPAVFDGMAKALRETLQSAGSSESAHDSAQASPAC